MSIISQNCQMKGAAKFQEMMREYASVAFVDFGRGQTEVGLLE